MGTKSLFAKILGYAQFGVQLTSQLFSNGVPHGWQQWVGLATSGAIAVATHLAAGTDGSN